MTAGKNAASTVLSQQRILYLEIDMTKFAVGFAGSFNDDLVIEIVEADDIHAAILEHSQFKDSKDKEKGSSSNSTRDRASRTASRTLGEGWSA